MSPPKAPSDDIFGRFREVISDPLNLLIERVPMAGYVEGGDVYLHNGNKVPTDGEWAYYGPFSMLLVLNRGVHEPLEEFVFQELLKHMPEQPLMLELGAYWAHYSMWLKKMRPHATAIMVEPHPPFIAVGKRNFARNGFTGEFIEAAVGKGRFELDAFMASRAIARVNILHVDIQSYEMEMLVGAERTLRNGSADYVFISTHSQELHQQVIDRLTDYGYRVEVSSDFDNDTTANDGLVFASGPNAQPLLRGFTCFGRTQIAESTADGRLRAMLRLRENLAGS